MTYTDFFSLPMDGPATVIVAAVIGAAGIGVALAYFIGDPRSPATRSLCFAVAMVGIANALYPPQNVLHPTGEGVWWLVGLPILDAAVMCGLFLWMVYVARSAQPSARVLRWVRICAGTFAVVTAIYLALGALYPVERMSRFLFCFGSPYGCSGPHFWLFAVPVSVMGGLLVTVGTIVFTQRIDEAERIRIICVAAATPFFFANYVLPAGYNVMTSLVGLFIFLIGGIRYHTILGERGRFLSRFLSREVVKQVDTRGLAYTMQAQKLELTVVCCDIRGFTHFSYHNDSNVVTALLEQYYEAVSRVAEKYEATVQDFAGDGVMMLVGAPIHYADHASRGLLLAQETMNSAFDITQKWSTPAAPLAIGIGVASGIVTVGAIGSTSRMEYAAIGTAMNLASRLCDIARSGQILVDTRTAELSRHARLEVRPPVNLKGLGDVIHYDLPAITER